MQTIEEPVSLTRERYVQKRFQAVRENDRYIFVVIGAFVEGVELREDASFRGLVDVEEDGLPDEEGGEGGVETEGREVGY